MKKVAYTVALIGMMAFLILLVMFEKMQAVDVRAAEILYENPVLQFFHSYGTYVIIAALVATIVCLLVKKNYRFLVIVLLTIGGTIAINQLAKNLIGRTRPETAGDLTNYSFPSGHTMISLAIVMLFAYVMPLYVKTRGAKIAIWVVAIILAVVIGLSRVAVGHHYLTDVLAGWALASSWVVLVIYWFEKKYGLKKKHAFSHINPYPYA
ncbi:phosphatase PAP2 family protein [Solibacillus sp. FSL H8-0523]|uniref:phosphatase PAP2 family protein n=1 Tax=unclassified Solibacillus TaxID=2637870 RepID=UPI003100C568